MNLNEYLDNLVKEARKETISATNLQELSEVKTQYLGKKSDINIILKAIWKGQYTCQTPL